jgi:hypothetical protein
MSLTSAPLNLAQPRSPASPSPTRRRPSRTSRSERESPLGQLTLVLDDLARRHPTVSRTTLRALAVDVLCQTAPERLAPSLVARVLEARLSALM